MLIENNSKQTEIEMVNNIIQNIIKSQISLHAPYTLCRERVFNMDIVIIKRN